MNETQTRAIARQETDGTPFERTKAEAKAEAGIVASALGDVRVGTVTVSTWLGASGDSYCLHLDSRDDGKRVAIHRWYSTGEVSVRFIFGSWWRPRKGREGEEFAATETDENGVVAAARTVLGRRYVVQTIHEGSDWAVVEASDEEMADADDETLSLEDARELGLSTAREMGCGFYDLTLAD